MRVDQYNYSSTSVSSTSMENLSDQVDYGEALKLLIQRVNVNNYFNKNEMELVDSIERQRAPRQGPRISGEGIDEQQGILCAFQDKPRELFVVTTMIAAGFVIGRGGQSMSYLSRSTRALITSFNRSYHGRKVRMFQIKGDQQALYNALKVLITAIEHYKDLIGGKYHGMFVDKVQIIEGIPFYYEPPPKEDVPVSARTIEVHARNPQKFNYITPPSLTPDPTYNSSPDVAPPSAPLPHNYHLMQHSSNNLYVPYTQYTSYHVVQSSAYYNHHNQAYDRLEAFGDSFPRQQQLQHQQSLCYVPVSTAAYPPYMQPQQFFP